MKHYLAGCALAALGTGTAFAQSTGSQQFEQDQTIVVTGTRTQQNVAGIITPDTSKTRQVLTSELIQHETPGQSINDIINLIPGVSFQNNDGYGSAGGFLTIRGFDQSRISETFDGIPLNDTGNYALYSNQQLDSELIDQVNVSLGSTDIDSPTPSATGSTINYTSVNPTDDFHVRLSGSAGSYDMMRIFLKVDTGAFTPFGTKLWASISNQTYNVPFNNYGKIDKQQYNFKIYQPIGSGRDFVAVAGNWNVNQNNFFGSAPLRNDPTILSSTGIATGVRVVGTGSTNRFPADASERRYYIAPCTRPTPVAGTAQTETSSSCGTVFDYRFNPSRTGNIRVNSRFGITDTLTLTVDPFFEYTDANGGGTVVSRETAYTKAGTATSARAFTGTGYFGGTFYAGHDLNGDGDTLDTLDLLGPSNTITHRYGVIANLLYNLTDTQTFRVNYTLDYGHHRQTGEAGFLDVNGHPIGVFPQGHPILDAAGNPLEKRDRLSLAILNQVAGQYRGKFFDERLTVDAGARAAFFQRKLDNHCFATGGTGNVDCTGQSDAEDAAYALANPYGTANPVLPTGFNGPQKRNYHFNRVLPSGGLTFQLTPLVQLYASYSKGLQVPGTDQLYNGFYYPRSAQPANPKPETSDNLEGGVRLRSGKVQALLAGWYTIFRNRIEQTYDPIAQLSTYTNLGTVHKYGVDGSIAYKVVPQFTLYAFGSYLHSKILDDVQIGTCSGAVTATTPPPAAAPCGVAGTPIYALTAGKRESIAPTYTFGGRAEGRIGPLEIGIQAKRTGPRYLNDQNTPVYQSYVTGAGATAQTVYYQVYGAKTPAYTLVDLDARLSLAPIVHNDRTWLQFNVTNLFNKFYVGALSTSAATPVNTSVTFTQIGAPRTISGTLVVGF